MTECIVVCSTASQAQEMRACLARLLGETAQPFTRSLTQSLSVPVRSHYDGAYGVFFHNWDRSPGNALFDWWIGADPYDPELIMLPADETVYAMYDFPFCTNGDWSTGI